MKNTSKEKQIYEEASIEIIIFEKNDIITDSAILLPEEEFPEE